MNKNLQCPTKVAYALAVTVALSVPLPMPSALAQGTNAPTEPAKLEKMVVTGSNIPTAETVAAAPVETVSTVELQKAASMDVLDALKKLSPSFSGNGNYGQTVNNGGGGEAYIALRNLSTLVLLDGQRLAGSAFSSGTAVDLNTIPVAMIERIEVLKDGASAIYGSEAIGGVVNIVTKKNFTGAEIGGRYGFATGKGSVSEQRAYVVAGTSNEKSSFTAGAQYYRMDPLRSSDRDIACADTSVLLSKGLMPPSYISPTYPGRVDNYILAGSPLAKGAPGYNPAITTPPVDPGVTYNTMADYLAAHPGVYIPISTTPLGQAVDAAYTRLGSSGAAAGWPMLNTPMLGTYSIQSQDRRQAFANGRYELSGKELELYASFLYANTLAEAALAPSPMSSLANGGVQIAADSPINPFQKALGLNAAGTPRVRTRFLDLGNRWYENQSDFYHFVGGLKGSFEGGYTYDIAYNYNRNDQLQLTKDAPNGAALELATKANTDPALAAAGYSQLTDPSGPVKLFNPFALPGGNDPRTIEALRTTEFEMGMSELWGVNANITGEPFKLPAGPLQFAIGGGFYTESLTIDYDGLTKMGKLIGFNQAFPTPPGHRDAWAGYVETRIPITSEEKNVTGLYSLTLTAAGRVEEFSPGGNSAVPKVGLRWQPIDKELTVRATYSKSFLAPNVWELFGAPVVSYDVVNAGGNGQVQMNWISNPKLKPADAQNWGAGIVASPDFLKGLTVSIDYYRINTKNDVYRVGAQAVADSLNANGSASEFASTFVFDDGSRLTTPAPNQVTVANWGSAGRPYRNGAKQETDGLDIRVDYELNTESAGRFSFFAASSVLFNYKYSDPLIGGPYQYAGQFTDEGPAGGAQGTLPDFVINAGVSWQYRDFTATAIGRYIPSVDDLGDMHPSAGSPVNDYTVSGNKWVVPSFFSVDLQLAYEFGKGKTEKSWYDGTRLAVGCNNISDEQPPFISSAFEDNTDKSTYGILGRFVYFEISKKF